LVATTTGQRALPSVASSIAAARLAIRTPRRNQTRMGGVNHKPSLLARLESASPGGAFGLCHHSPAAETAATTPSCVVEAAVPAAGLKNRTSAPTNPVPRCRITARAPCRAVGSRRWMTFAGSVLVWRATLRRGRILQTDATERIPPFDKSGHDSFALSLPHAKRTIRTVSSTSYRSGKEQTEFVLSSADIQPPSAHNPRPDNHYNPEPGLCLLLMSSSE
jgi:hypothetical protein